MHQEVGTPFLHTAQVMIAPDDTEYDCLPCTAEYVRVDNYGLQCCTIQKAKADTLD